MSGFVKLKKEFELLQKEKKKQHEAEASIPSSEIKGEGRGGGYINSWRALHRGVQLKPTQKFYATTQPTKEKKN